MRKFLNRFLCFFGLCFLILITTLCYSIYKFTQPKVTEILPGTVLKLTLDAPLDDMPSARHFPFQQNSLTSLRDIIDALDTAGLDDRIKGLVVHLDGVQFSGLAQIQELRNAIHAFRKTGKFAHVYCDTFGESSSGGMGLYYLAVAFDKIAMAPLGNLNITGLSSIQPFARRLLDDIGLHPDIEAREQYKTAYDSALKSEMSAPHRQETQELLDSLMNQMIQAIVQDRQLTKAVVIEAINKAPHFDLLPLQQAGFIDQISFIDHFYHGIEGKSTPNSSVSWLDFNHYVSDLRHKRVSLNTKIAVIFGNGLIVKEGQRSNPLMSSASMEIKEIRQAFKAAGQDPTIKAVVFRIDSPGGSPLVSDILWNAIRTFQTKTNKPLIVSMGNVAASGGYWIAAPADKIVANPGTITGSIGVLAGKIASAELWKKLNIQWDVVKTHDNSAIWNMIYPFSPEEKKIVARMTDHIYTTFIQKVMDGRHLTFDHVHSVAKGRVWTGEQALQWRLVDQLGDLNTAIHVAMQEAKLHEIPRYEIQIVYLPEHISLFTKLSNLAKGNFKITTLLAQAVGLVIQEIQSNWTKFQDSRLQAPDYDISY